MAKRVGSARRKPVQNRAMQLARHGKKGLNKQPGPRNEGLGGLRADPLKKERGGPRAGQPRPANDP
jgi:hypothetical protein